MPIPTVPIRKARVSELHEDPANARKHGERNRATVNASIREFGVVQLLVVEPGTGRVIGGNCTLGELRALGVEEVFVAEPNVHGIDATRLGVALNRAADLAEWDDEILAQLQIDGADLGSLGFSEHELAMLATDLEEVGGSLLDGTAGASPDRRTMVQVHIAVKDSGPVEDALMRAMLRTTTRGEALTLICEEWARGER